MFFSIVIRLGYLKRFMLVKDIDNQVKIV